MLSLIACCNCLQNTPAVTNGRYIYRWTFKSYGLLGLYGLKFIE